MRMLYVFIYTPTQYTERRQLENVSLITLKFCVPLTLASDYTIVSLLIYIYIWLNIKTHSYCQEKNCQ